MLMLHACGYSNVFSRPIIFLFSKFVLVGVASGELQEFYIVQNDKRPHAFTSYDIARAKKSMEKNVFFFHGRVLPKNGAKLYRATATDNESHSAGCDVAKLNLIRKCTEFCGFFFKFFLLLLFVRSISITKKLYLK